MTRLSILIFTIVLFTYDVYCSSISQHKCKEYSGLTRKNKEVEDLSNGWFHLPGKVPAEKGEFPHMVKLGYEHNENDTRRITWGCGGTLISDQFILTAATCRTFGSTVLFNRRSLRTLESKTAIPANLELPPDNSPIKFVKLGDKTQNEQILIVEEIILHPNMTPPSLRNDIALLKLSNKKVNFTEFIRPACLYSGDENFTNKTFVATGWGILGVGHYYSDDLMKLNLTAFSKERCQKEYAFAQETYKDLIDGDTLMCFGSNNKPKALCPGDGGGPFQIRSGKYQNMYDVVGIISFGYYCNLIKLPILSTRVASYVPWIENIVWST